MVCFFLTQPSASGFTNSGNFSPPDTDGAAWRDFAKVFEAGRPSGAAPPSITKLMVLWVKPSAPSC